MSFRVGSKKIAVQGFCGWQNTRTSNSSVLLTRQHCPLQALQCVEQSVHVPHGELITAAAHLWSTSTTSTRALVLSPVLCAYLCSYFFYNEVVHNVIFFYSIDRYCVSTTYIYILFIFYYYLCYFCHVLLHFGCIYCFILNLTLMLFPYPISCDVWLLYIGEKNGEEKPIQIKKENKDKKWLVWKYSFLHSEHNMRSNVTELVELIPNKISISTEKSKQ